MSLTVNTGVGFGGVMEGGVEVILRGTDAGIYLQPFNSVGIYASMGAGGAFSVNSERSYFIGEVKKMKLSTLNGAEMFVGGDIKTPYGGVGGEISVSTSIINKMEGSWLSLSTNVGAGAEVSPIKAGMKASLTRIGLGFDGKWRFTNLFQEKSKGGTVKKR